MDVLSFLWNSKFNENIKNDEEQTTMKHINSIYKNEMNRKYIDMNDETNDDKKEI